MSPTSPTTGLKFEAGHENVKIEDVLSTEDCRRLRQDRINRDLVKKLQKDLASLAGVLGFGDSVKVNDDASEKAQQERQQRSAAL